VHHHPGQEVRAGSLRKTPEIDGTWKQYSGKQIRRPDLSGSARNRQEPGKTGSRIRSPDSCVGFLTFSGGFRRETVRFLRVSAGKFTEYCVRNHRPGHANYVKYFHFLRVHAQTSTRALANIVYCVTRLYACYIIMIRACTRNDNTASTCVF
jgi:hypothetical protein